MLTLSRCSVAAAACLLAVSLASCGSKQVDPPALEAGRNVSCGDSVGWPISAMEAGIEHTVPREELAEGVLASIRDWLANEADSINPGELPRAEDVPWFVLQESPQDVTVAVGNWSADGPDDDAWMLGLVKEGGRWTFSGSGGCNLEPVIPEGTSWVQMYAANGDEGSRALKLMIASLACSTPADPRPVLRTPVVSESDDAVVIELTVTDPPPTPGVAYACPGSAPVETTVQLSKPLGDRVVFDGSRYPPRRITEKF